MSEKAEMSAEAPQSIEIDIRGQICPATLLVALKEINRYKDLLKAGSAYISFKTDNRDAIFTIPDSAANMGYVVKVTKTEGHYTITVSSKAID